VRAQAKRTTYMKTNILFLLFLLILIPAKIEAKSTPQRQNALSGRFLIQNESYGRAWYVFPGTKKRYYLRDATSAFDTLTHLALGMKTKDLNKIPTSSADAGDKNMVSKYKGYMILQTESHGEAWYVVPQTGYRMYVKDATALFKLIQRFGQPISNKILSEIPMNHEQIVSSYTFDTVASVALSGEQYRAGKFSDEILPLASLTKLMTALVLLDLSPRTLDTVVMTEKILEYPAQYVGDHDVTSEVALEEDDEILWKDLWTAMLLASSNQATVALADVSGVPLDKFVQLMNEKAKEFGLTRTRFFDVTGLDAHNVSTAREFVVIAKNAFDEPAIREASVIHSYDISAYNLKEKKTRVIPVKNRNYSLQAFEPDGAKTGYLVEAERNVAFKKNNMIIVVLHALSMKQRNTIISQFLKSQ